MKRYFAPDIGFYFTRRQLKLGNEHSMGGFGSFPSIFAEAQSQACLADTAFTNKDDFGISIT